MPDELGDLQELTILNLSENKISGEISEIKSKKLTVLNLSSNELKGGEDPGSCRAIYHR